MKIKSLISCAHSLLLSSCFTTDEGIFDNLDLPDDHRQIVLVTANNWDSTVGEIHLYQREGKRWVKHDSTSEVVFGKNGLAWGKGVHVDVTGTKKRKEMVKLLLVYSKLEISSVIPNQLPLE